MPILQRLFAKNRLVRWLYDWVLGSFYDVFMSTFAPGYRGVVRRFYSDYLPRHRPTANKAIEIGPGTGYVTSVLLRELPHAEVTCIDISRRMLAKLAARLAREPSQRQPKYICADITGEIGGLGGGYDLAVMQSIIEHLQTVPPGLANVYALLRPGGTLLLADIRESFWGRLFSLIFQVRCFTPDTIRGLLTQQGFRHITFLDYQTRLFFLRHTLFFVEARKPEV
jgi:SAM-dependent methyltransferase